MKILFDILTPKQARIAVAVWNRFHAEHELYITSRDYAETNDILKHYKIPFVSHGSYGYYGDMHQKFLERIKRLEFLTTDYSFVDVIITQASIEAVHLGVGLGKPVVVLTDAPKRKFLNRQIIPSATYHLREEFIKDEWEYDPDNIVYMDACQEHFYINAVRRKNPNLVVYRCFQYYSAYAGDKRSLDVKEQVEKFCKDNGYELLELERYKPHKFVPPERIFEKAVMVVTGGSSMGIEATLLGIPAISFYPYYYPKFNSLIEWGYPLLQIADISNLKEQMEKILHHSQSSHKFNDDPLEKLNQILEDIETQ